MADAKDPLALWRDMLSQWESTVNSLANTTMASNEYSSAMNGTMGMTLRMQESVREFMTAYLATTNLPSRTEVLAIAERLASVEARLDHMTSLLERIANAQGAAPAARVETELPRPRPARTKRPPGTEPTA